jgi:hypothetical protein
MCLRAINREAEFERTPLTAAADGCGSASFDPDLLGKITGLAGERQLLERAAEQDRRHPGDDQFSSAFPARRRGIWLGRQLLGDQVLSLGQEASSNDATDRSGGTPRLQPKA